MRRRTFLKTAAKAATGAGAAIIAPRLIRGASRGPAGRRYRVGVIGRTGRGNYGHGLDTAWLAIPETEIVAVADESKQGLAAAAKRLKVERAFSDWRDMIEKTRPDVVAICLRWLDEHAAMAVAAAERGIHVLMEKPMCRTLAEADRIVAACQKTGAKLAIAHPTRYSPRLAAVKRLIAEGKMGKVLEYRARGKEDRRGGGEDLWVLGTHVLDAIHALAGRPKWCFAHVTQDGQPVTRKHVHEGNEGIGPLAGDAVRAMYGMPDGSTAYFGSHRNAAGKPWRYALQVFGSRGIIEITEGTMPDVKYLGDPSWSPGRSGAGWQNVSSAGIARPEPLTGPEYAARHTLAIRDLLAAVKEDRQPLGGPAAGRDVVEMIVSVFESHRLGRPATLPLENRENPLTMLGG